MAVKLAYQIVENLELLLLILAIFFTWYFATCHFVYRKSVLKKHEGIVALLVLAFIFKAFPFDIFSVEHITGGDTNFSNIIIRVFFYILVLIFLKPWFSGFSKSLVGLFKVPYIKPLLYWGLISFAWSETPIVTIRSFLVVIGVACLAAHFARKFTWSQIDSIFRWSILIFSVVGFVSMLLRTPLPGSIGISSVNLEGSLSNKELANLVSLGSILWISNAITKKRNRGMSIAIGVASFFLILFLNSATNIITVVTLLYVLLLFLFVKKVNSRYVAITIWATILLGIVSALVIQVYSANIFILLGKSPTLSGRTSKVWPPVVEEILEKPWTGYGYVGYWQGWRGAEDPSLDLDSSLRIATKYSDGALSHAHNGLLELGLQLGLPGMILFILSLLSGISASITHFFKYKNFQIAILPIIFFVHMNLACLTETPRLGFVGPNYIWFFFVMTQVCLISKRRLP